MGTAAGSRPRLSAAGPGRISAARGSSERTRQLAERAHTCGDSFARERGDTPLSARAQPVIGPGGAQGASHPRRSSIKTWSCPPDPAAAWKVLRKVLRSGATEFRDERARRPLPKLGPWQAELCLLLEENAGQPPRERLTLLRVFEALRGPRSLRRLRRGAALSGMPSPTPTTPASARAWKPACGRWGGQRPRHGRRPPNSSPRSHLKSASDCSEARIRPGT
jgi:hypothetical protein